MISNMNARPSLLVNQVPSPNHWIGLRLQGTKSNRDGIGARVTAKVGTRILVDEVRSGSSYDSNNDMRIHFGLGAATKMTRSRFAGRAAWLSSSTASPLTRSTP